MFVLEKVFFTFVILHFSTDQVSLNMLLVLIKDDLIETHNYLRVDHYFQVFNRAVAFQQESSSIRLSGEVDERMYRNTCFYLAFVMFLKVRLSLLPLHSQYAIKCSIWFYWVYCRLRHVFLGLIVFFFLYLFWTIQIFFFYITSTTSNFKFYLL